MFVHLVRCAYEGHVGFGCGGNAGASRGWHLLPRGRQALGWFAAVPPLPWYFVLNGSVVNQSLLVNPGGVFIPGSLCVTYSIL